MGGPHVAGIGGQGAGLERDHPTDRQTYKTEDITYQQTTYAGDNNS